MRISDWSSDVCSSDLRCRVVQRRERRNSRRSRTSRAGMQTPLFNPASIKLSHQAAAVRWAAEPQRSIWFWVAAMIENQKIRPAMVIGPLGEPLRSEEHTSELQSLMRISYAVFCLKKKKNKT